MTPINIAAEVKALKRMTVKNLHARYAEVFGEASRSFSREHLIKRIAWRIQALREGDLSERARQRARELANDADIRIRAPAESISPEDNRPTVILPFHVPIDERLPMPGTLLTREYKGTRILVRVLSNGFDFEGDVYRSLSAIAKKITGAHWNGFHFFGLPKPRKELGE